MDSTTHYSDLGLVNTRDMFNKALEGQYAVPAYNFNNMEQLQGIILGCVQSRSPVILQVSGSARKYANQTFLKYMAISIGTSHGADKFKVKPGEAVPSLRFDILDEIAKKTPGFPIVLHGASTVVPEYVEMINRYGGKMDNAVGNPQEQLW